MTAYWLVKQVAVKSQKMNNILIF